MSNATGYSAVAARLNGVNQIIEGSPSGNVNYIILEFRPASTSEAIFQFDVGEDLTLNGASGITTNGLGTVTQTFQKGSQYEVDKWVRVRYDFSSPVAITAFTAGLVGATYGEVDFSYIECDLFTLEYIEGRSILFDATNTTTTAFSYNGTWVYNLSGKENGETHNGITQFLNKNLKKYVHQDSGAASNHRFSADQTLAIGEYLEMAGWVGYRNSDIYRLVCARLSGTEYYFQAAATVCNAWFNGTTYTHPNTPIVGYNVVRLTRVDASNYTLTLNGVDYNISESRDFIYRTIGRIFNTNYLGVYDYWDINGTVENYSTRFRGILDGPISSTIYWINLPEDLNNLGQDIAGQSFDQKITDGSNNEIYWQNLPALDGVNTSQLYEAFENQYIDYGQAFSEDEFTLMFVISGDALASETNKILFDARDADNDGIRVWLNGSGYMELQYNTQDLNNAATVSNGAQLWTVIADASNLYLRIDGTQVATAAKTGGSISTTVNAILGAESFGTKTNYWTGLIAEFFPVKVALSGSTLTDKEDELMTKYGI